METLPSEIITHILEYLSFDDRRELARVNKVFYNASSHPTFSRKELFKYCSFGFDVSDFKNMLHKSKRKWLCLKFHTFLNSLKIFTDLGNHIISLHLIEYRSVNDSLLDAITKSCSNLEELKLKEAIVQNLTDSGRKPILKLRSITLDSIMDMTDKKFNVILKLAPNLKNLTIFNCDLVDKYTATERFYPPNSNIDCSFTKYNSNDIFSENNIVHHLNHFVRLNSLRITCTTNVFCQIQPIQLEIKSLWLNISATYFSRPSNLEKLNLLLGQYVFLEQLEIFDLPVSMLSVVSKLYNLRHLKISYTLNSFDELDIGKYLKPFVESLKNLKHIRKLSFYKVYELNHLKFPIYPFPECTLKSLTSLDCFLDSDLRALKFCKNLTSLVIRNGDILKVEDLQLLFRNFTNLRCLSIENCSVFNDEMFIKLPISNLKDLNILAIMSSKISHQCLRHITNSRLRSLTLSHMTLESCSTQDPLTEFKQCIEVLSRAVPLLTELNIHVHPISKHRIDTMEFMYYLDNGVPYFKKMRAFEVW